MTIQQMQALKPDDLLLDSKESVNGRTILARVVKVHKEGISLRGDNAESRIHEIGYLR